jgi:hypothetical protein
MNQKAECSLAEGFSIWEKAYAQVSFFTMAIAGTVGIMVADWPWALPYVAICWFGVPGIVMRHLVCPRCPHLFEFGDCLQAPPSLTRLLVKTRKTSPLSSSEKLMFCTIFVLIPTYPVYWLVSNTTLLVAFAISAAMWYSGQFLYFCKRCRVYDCPFNRVPSTHPAGEV